MLAQGMPEDWPPPGFMGGALANGEPRISLEHRQRLWVAFQQTDLQQLALEKRRVSKLVNERADRVAKSFEARQVAYAQGRMLLQRMYKLQEQALVAHTLHNAAEVEAHTAVQLCIIATRVRPFLARAARQDHTVVSPYRERSERDHTCTCACTIGSRVKLVHIASVASETIGIRLFGLLPKK